MNDINVNALISYDNIKIIAVAEKNNNIINIHEESISSNNSLSKRDIKVSIKKAINDIEEKLSKKINSINIIFDDFMKSSEHLKFSTKIVEEKIEFSNNKFLSINDCNKIIDDMYEKSKNAEVDKKLISITPFKFIYVEDVETFEKESPSFPVDKRIKKLKVLFSIRYMDKSSYLASIDLFDLLNIKIKDIILDSQIAIYDNNENAILNNDNETSFTLAIENNKTMLITSVNNIVIKTDNLNFSFSNLIKKIAYDFGISTYEAKKIINCYGKLNDNGDNNKEIIYFSHSSNGEISKSIKVLDVINITKSFLKSICIQANDLIKSRINKANLFSSVELKFVGQLSKINNVTNYCSKYFEKVKIALDNKNESIYEWNKPFMSIRNYLIYTKVLNNLKSESFYYNSNYVNNNYKRDHLFVESTTKQSSSLLLV